MTDKRNVEMADLFRLKFITEAQLSPDGNSVIYAVQTIDGEKEEVHQALWMMCLETGETHQFTSGKTSDSSPAWSPDGKQIAFLSARDGAPQIYVIPADGGEARSLTSMKQAIGGGPVWSPDGKFIAFTAGPKSEPPAPGKPYRLTRNIYRFDGAGYLDPVIQDIYVIPSQGGDPKQLTDDRNNNSAPVWSPDGQEIIFSSAMRPDSHKLSGSLKLVDMQGKVFEVLGEDWQAGGATWLPDGKGIVFAGQPCGKPIGSKNDLWVVNRHGGKPECRTANLKVGVGGGIQPDFPASRGASLKIKADGQSCLMNVQDGGTIQIYEIALKGNEDCRPLIKGDRSCIPLGLSDKNIFYAVSTLDNPLDLYLANLDGSVEKRLTNINQELISTWNPTKTERLLFKGSDEEQVEGWIMTPFEGKAPYPTILYIHGGPHSAFGHMFSFDFQMLAGAGFAVLFINHRASTGYGDKFSTAIKGDWGNLDYHDLMAGVDYAIEKGFTDPDKMGCCGISGGGNLSCWIVGNTDRFKAAVPENPVTNWVSFYGVSDIGVMFGVEELGGHPHEIPEIYRKCSPISYAHHCKTPTLLVQGEADYRCPAEQSEQFYTVLKANGCIVEMVRLPNSSHAGSIMGAPAVRKAQNEALLDWMNRYVMGKTK
jgi:dipeptidyl aminopeptidase/acylaminoacyl peptidase